MAGSRQPPLLSASTQTGLESTYHSPWSVAGGATWRGERTAVHTTVEWFSAVDPYDILEPAADRRHERDDATDFRGGGLERRQLRRGPRAAARRDGSTLYGGVARNNSPWRPESETLASWNLTDVTAGISVKTSRARVAIGIGYAWGDGTVPRTIDPPFQPRSADTSQASFSRWTFSVGASTHEK